MTDIPETTTEDRTIAAQDDLTKALQLLASILPTIEEAVTIQSGVIKDQQKLSDLQVSALGRQRRNTTVALVSATIAVIAIGVMISKVQVQLWEGDAIYYLMLIGIGLWGYYK